LGDSTAAGYGVTTRAETPGAHLATWLAEATRRPVRLTCPAVVGAVSAWLGPQVEAVLEAGVDLAVILVGANDVTARVAEATAVRHLFEAVRALRTDGAEVVVATCPDLGTIQPIRPPLRWLARRWSRQLATAQTIAAVEAGGRTVSLGNLLGPQFAAAPEHLFGLDRYHPSADGYRLAAAAILPTALAALGRPGAGSASATVRALPAAAAVAAHQPGTEVSGAAVAGLERGPAGRWAQLSRRVRTRPRNLAPGNDDAVPSLAGPETAAGSARESSAESAVE
ncbi:MAG: SGNH/GDSL hydrolase family protein, partial [Micromonosporaceae bacterium]